MNKKAFVLLVIVMLISFAIYKIVINVINEAVDEANQRGIDLYVSSINYAYTAYLYKNGKEPSSIEDLNINVVTKVECEDKKIYKNGKIELHGCTVENSKMKYGYVNGEIVKE